MKHPKTITAIIAVIATIAVILIAGLAVMYSGVISVAADKGENPLNAWVLNETMESSVEHHASAIQPPADLASIDPSLGVSRYTQQCVLCHGGLGFERSDIGRSLNPLPPDLQKTGSDWTNAQVYWIASHGIKMTGMPAFGSVLTEEELWAVTAFVKKMPRPTTGQAGQQSQPSLTQ